MQKNELLNEKVNNLTKICEINNFSLNIDDFNDLIYFKYIK
jgi:hypothetical protein